MKNVRIAIAAATVTLIGTAAAQNTDQMIADLNKGTFAQMDTVIAAQMDKKLNAPAIEMAALPTYSSAKLNKIAQAGTQTVSLELNGLIEKQIAALINEDPKLPTITVAAK